MTHGLGYVKNNEDRLFSFHYDYKQTWDHKFNMQGLRAPGTYVKMLANLKDEREKECILTILKYVVSVNIASKNQIARYLTLFGFDVTNLEDKLNDMIEKRLLNMFALAAVPLPEIPEDALRFYCLDMGGKEILNHFGRNELLDWLSINSVRSTELVNKYLTTNEFQLALLSKLRSAVSYFNSPVDLSIGTRFMRMSGEFRIQTGSIPRDYLLEVIRSYDVPLFFRNKSEKISELLNTRHVERYFKLPPTIILMAENDEQLLECAGLFYRMCGYDDFFLTSDLRINEGMGDHSFLRYDHNSETLEPVMIDEVL